MYRTCIWRPLRQQNEQVCRRISSSVTRHNKESGEKEKKTEGDVGKKDGFFLRFKQELMSEVEKNEKEPDPETGPPKPSFSERVASIREMLDKEKIAERAEKIAQQAKDKSTQSYEQASEWKANYYAKKQEEKEAAAAEPPKESKIKKKLSGFMESSGLSENVYISQAQQETENIKKKLSSSVAEQMADLSKKFSEGKSSVEESDFLKKSKEALEQSEKLAKEALEQSEKLAKEASERLAKEKEELIKSEKLQKISEVTADTVKTAAEDFYDPVRLKESETYKFPPPPPPPTILTYPCLPVFYHLLGYLKCFFGCKKEANLAKRSQKESKKSLSGFGPARRAGPDEIGLNQKSLHQIFSSPSQDHNC
eukprot:sb/3465881/